MENGAIDQVRTGTVVDLHGREIGRQIELGIIHKTSEGSCLQKHTTVVQAVIDRIIIIIPKIQSVHIAPKEMPNTNAITTETKHQTLIAKCETMSQHETMKVEIESSALAITANRIAPQNETLANGPKVPKENHSQNDHPKETHTETEPPKEAPIGIDHRMEVLAENARPKSKPSAVAKLRRRHEAMQMLWIVHRRVKGRENGRRKTQKIKGR